MDRLPPTSHSVTLSSLPATQEQRLHAVQRLDLDLGLLVDAKHHRLVGLIQVQASDVANLLHKERVGGKIVAVRWPGFSGQPPSLTSEAGHHP